MPFQTAVKSEAKLRLALAGPSGSGKTYTALAIATALGGPVAVVDTEHGSASKYADLFPFDVLEMRPPFHPDRFVKAIEEARVGGYNVLILDSLTHAWQGTGGLLDVVDEIAKRKAAQRGGTPNTFEAWKDATPIQNRLVDAIVNADLHIIACIRSKQEYAQEKDERGKTVIRKVGMSPQQREGFEYEFDVFGELDQDNTLAITKTRCPALTGRTFTRPGADIAGILAQWLHGAPAERKPAPPAGPQPPTNGHAPEPEPPKPEPQPAPTTARPMSPDALRTALRTRAAQMPADTDPKKTTSAGMMTLADMFRTDENQHAAIRYLFDKEHRSALTPGEMWALSKWRAATKNDAGEWIPNGYAIEEARLLLEHLTEQNQIAEPASLFDDAYDGDPLAEVEGAED